MNRPSSTLSEYSNMTALAKTESKMNPNKKDLHVVELLQKSIATGNPCLDFSYERLGDAGAIFLRTYERLVARDATEFELE